MKRTSYLFLTAGLGLALAAGCGGDTTDANGPNASADATVDGGTTSDGGSSTPDPGSSVDTPRPDTGDKETVVGPDIPLTQGGFAWPCQSNQDCDSGWCVEGEEGYVCTKTCDLSCPAGWDCKSVSSGGADLVFLCVPRFQKLCVPCTDDLQCNGGRCLQIDGEGQCTFSCDVDEADSCPEGFSCLTNEDAGGDYCSPNSGSCSCTTETAGAQRGCQTSNDIGTCTGVETCDPTVGWTGCTALEPAVEDCDGGDNDCDGFIDEDLPVDEACENTVDGVGSCAGVRVCQGINGWVCQGPQPSVETCDFLDNDCDGDVDEDFKAGDVYQSFEHCGTCNYSCGNGFPNAKSTECLVFGQTPQCVVSECEEGYVKANDFQCLPDAASLCQPCATDANCLGTDSACIQLAEGTYCSQSCTSAGDCPQGYDCESVPGASANQCVPTSGSCSCDGTNTELQRSCSVTYTPPAPQPEYTCNGFEQCTADGWGDCGLPVEECDAVDNDCNGQTDEGFVNGDGVYDKVEHCGGCGISCLALGFANATPACDISGAVPQCTFSCNPPYQDVDGNPTNGCECLPQAGDDLVGDGVDTNCDGIDGEVNNGIFVAKNGDDGNPGTIDLPKLTIASALTAASSGNKRDVYVATGVYGENIVLLNGKGLFGGYSPDFTSRSPLTQQTAILGDIPSGNEAGTITAAGVGNSGGAATIVDGFTIFGPNAANQAGASSYAVYLSNCGPGLFITNNRILGGAGGNGASGNAGQDGNDGSDGADGQGVYDTGDRSCGSGDHQDGGAGGSTSCQDNTNLSGGDGGRAQCPDHGSAPQGAEAGGDGLGNAGGDGGQAGWDNTFNTNQSCGSCLIPPDNNPAASGVGQPGGAGADGSPGNGCNSPQGTVTGGQWFAGGGISGNNGLNGSGGGGGGSGGGVEVTGSQCASTVEGFGIGGDDIGGSGGGGGGGGCLGTSGVGGQGGGGSFAIFIVYESSENSLPVLEGNTIRRGLGGQGGTGGPGGSGGLPGAGGNGGPFDFGGLTWCAFGGGEGGDGGRGGHGGGGGGGCGGASYGIYAHNATGTGSYTSANTFEAGGSGGAGGQGGPSLGNSGGAGQSGTAADTNF